jgi:hypothetical protein
MFPNLAFPIKRSGYQHRVGFDQHFTHVFQSSAASVAESIEVVDIRKRGQYRGNVFSNGRVTDTSITAEPSSDEVGEKSA